MRFSVLGPVEVTHDGEQIDLSPDKTAIIALLVMADGKPLKPPDIIEGVYEARKVKPRGRSAPKRQSIGSLRVAITELRKALVEATGADPIRTEPREGDGYRLSLEGHTLDVVEFRTLLDRARRLVDVSPTRSLDAYESALAMVRGVPLLDAPGIDSTQDFVRDIDRDVLNARRERIGPAVAVGRGGDFILELKELVAEFPMDEPLWRWLMASLSMAGRHAEAEDAFREYETYLDVEHHGAIPSQEISSLFTLVLRREIVRPVRQLPLPATVDASSGPRSTRDRFVPVGLIGRGELLESIVNDTNEDEGPSVSYTILQGDAGVGKSRLAYEVARRAHDDGSLVLHGRVEPELQSPYGPSAEMIRYVLRNTTDVSPNDVLGSGVAELARIVPELHEHLHDAHARVPVGEEDLDAATQRFRLLEALVEALARLSRVRNVTIVIDDIHDASAAILDVLRYLARSPARLDVTILATARPVPSKAGAGDFDRHLQAMAGRVVEIPGLDLESCVEFVATVRGDLDARAREIVSMIHVKTGGNSFFVSSIVRSLEAQDLATVQGDRWVVRDDVDRIDIPSDVLDIVAERFDGLTDEDLEIARTAATIGNEFEMPLLIASTGDVASVVGSVIRRLANDGVLIEVPGGDGRWRFSHDLLRESLFFVLSREERAPRHRRVAVALDRMRGSRDDLPCDALSFHYYRSLWEGDLQRPDEDVSDGMPFTGRVARAIECCESGAAESTRLRQFAEEAVFHNRHLKTLHQWDRWATKPVFDSEQEITLLIRRGRALREAADPRAFGVLLHACLLAEGAQARDVVDGAIDRLSRQGWQDDDALSSPVFVPHGTGTPVAYPVLLGRAAGANTHGTVTVAGGPRSRLRSAWLERALQQEEYLDDRHAAILNARLAMERIFIESPDVGLARAERAFEMARRANLSIDTQLRIMNDLLNLLWRPDKIHRRIEIVNRMEQMADDVEKPRWLWAANSFGFQIASELGDMEGADRRLSEMIRLADDLNQPRLVQGTKLRHAVREAIRGDLDRSEQLTVERWRTARAAGDADADLFLMGQLYTIHLHRDELHEPPSVPIGGRRAAGLSLAQLFAAAYAFMPTMPVIVAALVAGSAVAEDAATTEHWLSEWKTRGARETTIERTDLMQLAAVAALSIGATYVRDIEVCEELSEILSLYESSFIDNGTSYHGSAAHYQAGLLGSLGRYKESDEMYAFAVEQNRSISSPPFEGMSLVAWAESLATRSPSVAREMTTAAAAVAVSHPQLRYLRRRVERLEPRINTE